MAELEALLLSRLKERDDRSSVWIPIIHAFKQQTVAFSDLSLRHKALQKSPEQYTSSLLEELAKLRQEKNDFWAQHFALQKQLGDVNDELRQKTTQLITLSLTHHALTVSDSKTLLQLSDMKAVVKEKNFLIQNLQDENSTLTLEIGKLDEEVIKLRKDNRSLLERWLEAKNEEVDRMNQFYDQMRTTSISKGSVAGSDTGGLDSEGELI